MNQQKLSPTFEILSMTQFGIIYGGIVGIVTGLLTTLGFGVAIHSVSVAIILAMIGAIVGGGIGFINGVIIGFIHLFARSRLAKMDITNYARILMFLSGIFYIVAVTQVVLNYLWTSYPSSTTALSTHYIESFFKQIPLERIRLPEDILLFFTSVKGSQFLLPAQIALFSLLFVWGFLACASTVHYVIHSVFDTDEVDSPSNLTNPIIFTYFKKHLLKSLGLLFCMMIGISTFFSGVLFDRFSSIKPDGTQFVLFSIISIFTALVIATCSALFFGFINRVVFVEFFPHWSQETYTKVAVVCVAIMAGCLGFLYAGILGGVVMGLVFGNATRSCIRNQNGEKEKVKHTA
jgi:hypothetical protein